MHWKNTNLGYDGTSMNNFKKSWIILSVSFWLVLKKNHIFYFGSLKCLNFQMRLLTIDHSVSCEIWTNLMIASYTIVLMAGTICAEP